MRTMGIIALVAALATPVAALSIVETMTSGTNDHDRVVQDAPDELSKLKNQSRDKQLRGPSPIHSEILDTQIG